ncbi:MAG: glutamine synthetase family protein [Rhodothalassiaceae bacterium]
MAASDSPDDIRQWLIARSIDDIECIIPDMAAIGRGKSLPRRQFLDSLKTGDLWIPESVLAVTVHGEIIFNPHIAETERDLRMVPDLATLRPTPWQADPTASVLCDLVHDDGTPASFAPRQLLRHVVALYEERGWRPIVAPEFEFFLIAKFASSVESPRPPTGRSGRQEFGQEPYSIDGVDEFGPLFDRLYAYCEDQKIDIATIIQEEGAAQYEINMTHGPALGVADQSFLFKRLVRQVAMQHNMFASFMAKPYPEDVGSAMHIHQSVVDAKTGRNVFSEADGTDTELFRHHIGGLQTYLPQAFPLMAPYVNSYRRFVSGMSAPTNVRWGRENRTVGLRVPRSGPEGRRIENRLAGSDVNPYLAIAASLACGLLGMIEKIEPSPETTGKGYEEESESLPRHYLEGLRQLERCKPLRALLGDAFIDIFVSLKKAEYLDYSSVLSPWEMRHLMVTV